jgi:hypothetical protein
MKSRKRSSITAETCKLSEAGKSWNDFLGRLKLRFSYKEVEDNVEVLRGGTALGSFHGQLKSGD